ncbi:MAG: hypothetical protein WD971_02215 [Pirellulales bacterium]
MEEAPRKPIDSRRRKRRSDLLIVGGVLAVLAGALAYAARDLIVAPADDVATAAKPQAASEPLPPQAPGPKSDLVDDDGQTLWASPTHGQPIELAYLPPGVEIVLALRPAELLAHPEGEKVSAALGPLGEDAISLVEQAAGTKLDGIERLLVGWQIARDGSFLVTLVVTTKSPLEPQSNYYQPERGHGRVTVIAPPTAIAEIRELDGHDPPLARDLERMLSRTDSSRDVTIMLRPHALLSDGNHVDRGMLARLRRPLEWFLGDDVGAASLSMHWDENFFIELIAAPTLDSSPERMSDELARRVDELPDRVEEFVLGLEASPYGRRVVARLPEMVRRLAAYTRHGFDRDCAVLRCYLPAVAGHNLLMGAELALAEGERGGERAVAPPLAEASSPTSIAERLKMRTSLRIAREELEAALNMLAQDVGVEIVIRGQDLQLDGITRNQLLGIEMADAPAAEILVEILRRANPDKLATGPGDPRQKLVYVVGPEAIFITTRAKAAERGERLPDVFQPK